MCGISVIFGSGADKKEAEFIQMLETIKHRGEETRSFSSNQVLAGVSRLKIVDRDNAFQPLLNADKSHVIVFNGEVFNYKEIFAKLTTQYNFQTHSDTETVLYAFLHDSINCLPKLEGQYAFIIIDIKNNKLFCTRDRIGIKPLYYVSYQGLIYIASEMKALTFLKQKISCLKPGHFMDESGVEKPYSSLQIFKSRHNLNSSPQNIRDILIKSIQAQADTDLPLGVIYSGGLDSSIVLDQAVKFHSNIIAFTVGCANSEDFNISKQFCKEKGIKQVLITLKSSDFNLKKVKEAIRVSELSEYGDIINAIITMELFKKINSFGIKVVLTGDGSDELFGGYNMYSRQDSPDDIKKLFQYKIENLHRTELQRVDRCSMYYGVEARVPFLSTEVILASQNMPHNEKIHHGIEKWCLRNAFKNDLPEYILKRKKNPMSHSSGLHEGLRRYKIYFEKYYNHFRYDLLSPIRMDFSYLLKKYNNIDQAINAANFPMNYGKYYLATEFIKATIRNFIS